MECDKSHHSSTFTIDNLLLDQKEENKTNCEGLLKIDLHPVKVIRPLAIKKIVPDPFSLVSNMTPIEITSNYSQPGFCVFKSSNEEYSKTQEYSENRKKRSWSRAVFSNLQRKGLEKRFSLEKYITKPNRRKLANQLGLTDAQVKIWFQNRRMKWRHKQDVDELKKNKLAKVYGVETEEEEINVVD